MQFSTSSGLSVEIKEIRSRKVDREFQSAMSAGVVATMDGKMEFPAVNIQRANDVLVLWMTNLTEDQLNSDIFSSSDYDEILWEINKQSEKKNTAKS